MLSELTDEKLQDIYTNKKFRNQVAYAHGCYSGFPDSKFKYKKTCSYPAEWIVTEKQIALATKELERSQAETAKKHKNSLLFVGMGTTYDTATDIGNHRIRTEFLNKHGQRFFVEFGTGADYETARCDHSIDRDGDANNYGDLERRKPCRYTPKKILSLVNRTFDCNFTEIFIDNYDLSCEGIMCESPIDPLPNVDTKVTTIEDFATLVEKHQRAAYLKQFPDTEGVLIDRACAVTIKPGKKYTKVDIGTSGRFMVVIETGEIFGIKAYGVIHRGHAYGTLATINDWQWGGYHAHKAT